MGKTSRYGGRLSLIWNGVGAIALLASGSLPAQAAEPPHLPLLSSKPSLGWISTEHSPKQAVIALNSKQSTPEANTAEDLKPVPTQTDDLPALPVLEPYIFLDQSVSVPPIAPLEAPVVSTPSTPSISVPPLMPVVEPIEIAEPIEAAETVVAPETTETVTAPETAETIEAVTAPETAEMVEAVTPPETAETVDTTATAAVSAQAESVVPLEPPFLGGLAEQTEPSSATLPTTTASEPSSTQAISSVEIRPANVSRWPDPIPFGQPLPSN